MLRDDVLLLLTEAEGYVSGEEMREKLGVTRAPGRRDGAGAR